MKYKESIPGEVANAPASAVGCPAGGRQELVWLALALSSQASEASQALVLPEERDLQKTLTYTLRTNQLKFNKLKCVAVAFQTGTFAHVYLSNSGLVSCTAQLALYKQPLQDCSGKLVWNI